MKFACPHCQTPLEADDSFAGASVDCPMCGQSLVIPAPPTAEEPQLPDPAPSEPAAEPPAGEAELAPEAPDTSVAEELPPPPPPPPPPPKAVPKFRVVSKSQPSDPVSNSSANPAPSPSPEAEAQTHNPPPTSKPTPKFRVVSRPADKMASTPPGFSPSAATTAGNAGIKGTTALRDKFHDFTGLEKIEGFPVSELMSELFKKHKEEDIEEYFTVGTPNSTPPIEQVDTRWPKPWMFFRALAASIGIYLLFDIAWQYFHNNNLVPGMMLMGTIAVPFSALLFFYEVNVRRNISLYRVLKLFFLGGIISLILSLVLYAIVGDTPKGVWAEAAPGPIEEIGKLFALVWVARSMRHHYKINGLLMGAAVGTGFAVFESLGYALNFLIGGVLLESIGEDVGAVGIMKEVIFTRGVLSPLGHIVWTAIAGAALWRVKGKEGFNFSMLGNGKFWHLFLIPVVLHAVWDVSIPYVDDFPYYGKYVLLGVVAWFVVFALIQEGLKELRAEKLSVLETRGEG